MNNPSTSAQRRAERLLRWYPKEWRARYGDEFLELLMEDVLERPRSWRRDADVAVSALVARLAAAGLGGVAREPLDQARRSLAAFGCAAAVFLVFAVSMWSQLTIGWRWSKPDTDSTFAAMMIMTAAVLICIALAIAAAVPVAW